MKSFNSSVPLLTLVALFLAPQAFAGEHGMSFGYGFAVLNENESSGRIEGGRNYDFLQLTYQ